LHFELECALKALSEVERTILQWEEATTQREKLAAQRSSIEVTLKTTRQGESEAAAKIAGLTPRLRASERAVSGLEQARSEYEKLLDAALDHVQGCSCPVCGKEYSTRQELTERIRRLRGTLAPELDSARSKLAQVRTRLKALERARDKARAELASLTQRQTAGALRTAELEKSIQVFETGAVAAGLPRQVQQARTALSPAIQAARASAADARRRLEAQQSVVASLEKQVARASKEAEDLEARLSPIDSEMKAIREHLARIRGEASKRRVSLDQDDEVVGRELQSLNGDLASLESAISSSSAALEEVEHEAAAVKEASAEAASRHKELSAHKSQVDQAIQTIEGGFARLKLHSSEEAVSARLSELEGRRDYLEKLKEQVLALEAALDARATSAAQTIATRQAEALQKETLEIGARAAELRTWRTYFDNVLDRLRCVRGESLDQYIRYYEPLASAIQRRLRPVYGFGDMRLRQLKESIEVSVEKEGHERLAPNLYYSESQLQVAALSLFLSASLTQPWSAFAPILMDDPVTHFDDLNAYAYLELIIGLSADRKGRQFVLSTCEETLYRLMRRRLADMNVIFYEFRSIGEAGPRVERVG